MADPALSLLSLRSSPWHLAEGQDEGSMWLAWLVRLRWVAIFAQIITLSFTFAVLDYPAIVLPVLATAIGGLALANGIATRRLHRDEPVSATVLSAHLLVDVATLTVFFLAAGGAANPFVLVYLIHIAMGAVMLPWRNTVILTSVVCAANALLHVWHLPLHPQVHPLGEQALMSFGQIVAFTVTVVSITGFVAGTGRTLRRQKQWIIEARDRAAQTDRLRAVGTLAAGAAHELNTPLSTIGLRLRRIARRHEDTDTTADVDVMRTQVERCSEIVQQLLYGAGDPSASGIERAPLQDLTRRAVHLWSKGSKIDVRLVLQEDPVLVELPVVAFTQGLTNLLENAREAQEELAVFDAIEVQVRRESGYATVRILDRGPGLPERPDRIGEPFYTTKATGTGLGVFVARALASGAGGGLDYRREDGRTIARWYIREAGRAE